MQVGFLGIGNMGGAILKGYAENLDIQELKKIIIFDKNSDKINELKKYMPCEIAQNIKELVEKSDVLFLGVKPINYEEVLKEISQNYSENKIIVSMAAGISISYIKNFLGNLSKVVRIMPNTPAQVNQGMISMSVCENINNQEEERVKGILDNLGRVEKIDESFIHTVIGASGSSPAYVYYFIESMIKVAVENGMTEKQGKIFVAQSVKGAAEMVLQSEKSPKVLRENVCSPNGTTIEAVKILENSDFDKIVKEAFQGAVDKSKVMEK